MSIQETLRISSICRSDWVECTVEHPERLTKDLAGEGVVIVHRVSCGEFTFDHGGKVKVLHALISRFQGVRRSSFADLMLELRNASLFARSLIGTQ
jgi:hypothetical protein